MGDVDMVTMEVVEPVEAVAVEVVKIMILVMRWRVWEKLWLLLLLPVFWGRQQQQQWEQVWEAFLVPSSAA
jgi:hypothetical protein